MTKPVCAVLGVGPGNGLALARRFSEGGYSIGLCARRGEQMKAYAAEIADSRGYQMDVTDPAAVAAGFERMRDDLGPVETLIYNAGSAKWGGIDDLQPEDLRPGYEVNVIGLFSAVRAVLPDMRAAGAGNIVVIGASAAWRGRPGTLAFAAAKAAQLSVAQSLARQLGPEGIHVAYLVLDGVIDLETTKARMPDKPADFFMTAAGVAEAAWAVTRQDRQAWSFEIDLRPYCESW